MSKLLANLTENEENLLLRAAQAALDDEGYEFCERGTVRDDLDNLLQKISVEIALQPTTNDPKLSQKQLDITLAILQTDCEIAHAKKLCAIFAQIAQLIEEVS